MIRLPTAFRHPRKTLEHRHQEPGQPNALAFPLDAHSIHPVVPIADADERQSVRACGQAALDRPATVLVQAGTLHCRLWNEVHLMLILLQQRSVEERHVLLEDSFVSSDLHILGDHVWEPEKVIRDA